MFWVKLCVAHSRQLDVGALQAIIRGADELSFYPVQILKQEYWAAHGVLWYLSIGLPNILALVF